MKKIAILQLFILLLFSCKKNQATREAVPDSTCITGRIIAKGCYGKAIIQVISPRQDFLKASVYKTGSDQPLLDSISTNLPLTDAYGIGDLLYFTVKDFTAIGVTTTECIWPKYAAEIGNVSKNSCDSLSSK